MIATMRAKTNDIGGGGMSYIRGESREQIYLLLEAIDDYVRADNRAVSTNVLHSPARVVVARPDNRQRRISGFSGGVEGSERAG
jgi:hypothetical protein